MCTLFVKALKKTGKRMQGGISMILSFCQSERGFSLYELVAKTIDVHDQKIMAELLNIESGNNAFSQRTQLRTEVTYLLFRRENNINPAGQFLIFLH